DGARGRQTSARQGLVTGLSRVIGNRLVDWVEPGGDAPAMIEVAYRFRRDAERDEYSLEWQVSIRKKPDEAPCSKSWTSEKGWPVIDLQTGVNREVDRTLMAAVGQSLNLAPDVPMPVLVPQV